MPRIRHLLFLLTLLLLTTTIMSSSGSKTKTYYDALELQKDASPTTIKKAYRRLALKYHPDKNPDDPSAVDKFRTVSEAYEVLSDPAQKREYDRALKTGMGGGRTSGGTGGFDGHEWQNRWEQNQRASNSQYKRRDPFAQFNDLFQNDPFFREAADGLDDLFSQTFQQQNHQQNHQQQHHRQHQQNHQQQQNHRTDRQRTSNTHQNQNRHKQGWGSWIAEKLGVDIQMTSTTVDHNGQRTTSSFSQQSGSRSRTSQSSSSTSTSTYTSKRTKTVIENGKRVTIQSMERDGNKIEEKYVGTTLVGRTINGVPEQVGRIDL